jgi:hypothetical protein
MSKIQEALNALDEVKQAINVAYADGYKAGMKPSEWVDLTDKQIESIFLDAGWSWGEKADMYVPAVREVLKLFKEINE